jgi:hypothetical protein
MHLQLAPATQCSMAFLLVSTCKSGILRSDGEVIEYTLAVALCFMYNEPPSRIQEPGDILEPIISCLLN